MGPEEKDAEVGRHREWFRSFGAMVVGGEELDEPRGVKSLRRGRRGEGIVVTDGPSWPSLATQANATAQVHRGTSGTDSTPADPVKGKARR